MRDALAASLRKLGDLGAIISQDEAFAREIAARVVGRAMIGE